MRCGWDGQITAKSSHRHEYFVREGQTNIIKCKTEHKFSTQWRRNILNATTLETVATTATTLASWNNPGRVMHNILGCLQCGFFHTLKQSLLSRVSQFPFANIIFFPTYSSISLDMLFAPCSFIRIHYMCLLYYANISFTI